MPKGTRGGRRAASENTSGLTAHEALKEAKEASVKIEKKIAEIQTKMDHIVAKEEKSATINADTKKNIEKIDETFDDLKAKFDKENAKWHDILNDAVANDKDVP